MTEVQGEAGQQQPSAVQDFLSQLPKEGDPVVSEAAGEKQTLPGSAPENKPGSGMEGEKNLPFHQHPKWQRMHRENDDLKATLSKVERELADLRSQRAPAQESIPDWFSELFGDSQSAWHKYQAMESSRKEEIRKEILGELDQRQQQVTAEQQRWNQWVGDQIDGLKEEGLEFDDNELNAVMLKYRPTDENGYFDFHKGYEILQQMKQLQANPAKPDARKKLADMTVKPGAKAEPGKEKVYTAKDLKNKDFLSLAREAL